MTWELAKERLQKAGIYLFLLVLLALCLLPFYMLMINASRSPAQIQSGLSLLPSTHYIENLNVLKDFVNIWRGFANSSFIAITATVLTVYFSALTAHGFTFFEFKGKKFIFGSMLLFMMVPSQLGLIGFYRLCFVYGLMDSYVPLIVPSIANIFGIFFIRQYLLTSIHPALIEAARIDGCGELRIFHRLIIPMASPALATIGIMSFIGNWNSYLLPRVLITSLAKRTLPVMIGTIRGVLPHSNQNAIAAAVTISVFPIIIMFIFLNKYVINSISEGGVKG